MRRFASIRSLLVVALVSVASCREPAASGGASGGTLVMAIPGDPGSLLPPFAVDQISREVSDQLFDRLAEIGPDLNTVGDAGFQPRLARRWTWARDSLSIAFAIDPRARWHDGQPVRAADVRFTFELNRDSTTGSVITSLITNIDSVTTPDSLTAVVWFHRRTPEQFYDATYQLFILPEHVLARVPHAQLATSELARQPIGSGRFRFVRWEPGARIEIMADTANYRGRARLDRVIWSIAPDGPAAATQLFTGQSDVMDNLGAPLVPRVDSAPNLRILRYAILQYTILAFNVRQPAQLHAHGALADVRVRRALSMALDREAMLRNVFDTLGSIGRGPFPSPIGDSSITPLPFDRAYAAALLDSAGWIVGRDGMRSKGRQPLRFSIMLPTSSATRMRYAVLIQDQLKAVGADVQIDALAFPAFVARQQAWQFDAMINTIGMDPAPSGAQQYWTTGSASNGGQNYIGYSSPVVDAALDSAFTTFDAARTRALLHRAYAQIVADAPAVFLYEPAGLAAIHRRLRPEGVRADTWWANLPDWWIPANERIDRDRIGLRGSVSAARP